MGRVLEIETPNNMERFMSYLHIKVDLKVSEPLVQNELG